MKQMNKYINKTLAFTLFVVFLAGCSTGKIGAHLPMISKGDFKGAKKSITYLDSKSDGILYKMELGSILRYQNDYHQSNNILEQGKNLSDNQYKAYWDDYMKNMLLNPSFTTYRPSDYENVFLRYYKALNYLHLYDKDDDEENLNKAQVEIRNITNKLEIYANEHGAYEDKNKDGEKKKDGALDGLLKIFKAFLGDFVDKDKILYRDDAYLQYISGLIYEMAGEYQDARISYQKAGKLYKDGFADQYRLDDKISQRAYYDVARMMKKDGEQKSNWSNFLSEHSPDFASKMKEHSSDNGEIIIIEHLGNILQKKQLSLMLKTDGQNLIVVPILNGSEEEKKAKANWFSMIYGGGILSNTLTRYVGGGEAQIVPSKIVPLGPLSDLANQIGLIAGIGDMGMLMAVPYYNLLDNQMLNTELKINGEVHNLMGVSSLMHLALYEQLLNAHRDIYEELIRASLKSIIAGQAAKVSPIAGFVGKAGGMVTTGADTRSWITLPSKIRIKRITLPVGEHKINFEVKDKDGNIISSSTESINIAPNKIKILVKRNSL